MTDRSAARDGVPATARSSAIRPGAFCCIAMPYPFDFEAVAAEAARRGVWLEINASPERLDLHGPLLRIAKAKGVKFVIATDAHHPKHLLNMPFGVMMARRGWLEAGDVMNTLAV